MKYFGKTISEDIESYEGSGVRWQRHLKKHGSKSIHLWNSNWYYDTSIIRFATKFSNINKIVESKEWANLAVENGIQGGYLGESVSRKIGDSVSKTRSNVTWKNTIGKQATQKASIKLKEKFGDPDWINTRGIEKSNKISATKNDLIWKDTIGKTAGMKMSKTKSNQFWKDTIGKTAGMKMSKTKNTAEWKDSVDKERKRKYSETVNSNEWKEKTYVICEYCGNGPMNRSNYIRWHGSNCKNVKK